MKLKFILILLAILELGLVGCSDEKKVVENKKESIVDVTTDEIVSKSTTSSKWFTPTNDKFIWNKAQELCKTNGGRLPTIDELKKVVTDCGGKVTLDGLTEIAAENYTNESYQSCYMGKGFSVNPYWSSNTFSDQDNIVMVVAFNFGFSGGSYDNNKQYVRCIRE